MPEPSPQAVAVHEAGHAVTAYLLGKPFTKISVVPDGDYLGQVSHAPARGDWLHPDIEVNTRIRNYLEAHVMICLAGAETVAAWYKRHPGAPDGWEDLVDAGAQYDLDAAVQYGSYLGGDTGELEAYLEWLRWRVLNKTGRPLTDSERESGYPQRQQDRITQGDPRFWALVEALASALADTPVLSWRKAKGILRDAEPRPSAEDIAAFIARTRVG